MTRVAVVETIRAAPETVFRTVSEIERFPDVQPEVLGIEFLTDQRSGVGTRFIETRRQGKQEMKTELEVTEWVEPERVRMVTDSHGTIWDTVFEIRSVAEAVELTIAMDARPHKFPQKIMVPILKGFFRKGIVTYMELLKTHCEAVERRSAES